MVALKSCANIRQPHRPDRRLTPTLKPLILQYSMHAFHYRNAVVHRLKNPKLRAAQNHYCLIKSLYQIRQGAQRLPEPPMLATGYTRLRTKSMEGSGGIFCGGRRASTCRMGSAATLFTAWRRPCRRWAGAGTSLRCSTTA
jgi:hypothetical protein